MKEQTQTTGVFRFPPTKETIELLARHAWEWANDAGGDNWNEQFVTPDEREYWRNLVYEILNRMIEGDLQDDAR